MQTVIGVGSPQAVKRWANALADDTEKQMYFARNGFIGKGGNYIIDRKVDLESDEGDRIQFDLAMNLRGGMVEGDNVVEGTEEALTFYEDEVRIDQARKGADAGGRMSRKRTLLDLRSIAKNKTARFVAEWFDELMIVYLSGTTDGINEDAKVTKSFAGNPIQAPDAYHMVYGGSATSKASLTSGHKMSRALIERLSVKPRMMASTNPDVVKIEPVLVEGKKHYVLLMSPWQTHDLRTETGELSWAGIQREKTAHDGANNPLIKGGVGMLAGVVLHEHENVRRFSDYGVGSPGTVAAARALFMGAQAGALAYGQAGNGTRFTWVEELKDAKNRVSIYAGTITGFKKTRFNGLDYGVIAVDTAATDPNPAVA